MDSSTQRKATAANGFFILLLNLAVLGGGIFLLLNSAPLGNTGGIVAAMLLIAAAAISMAGLFVVQPNSAKALVFFGKYIGSVDSEGFWWANPLAGRRDVSLRVNNFNSEQLKVNDERGNPIEIAAVVVWRVGDTARALFDVQNYHQFVSIQSETVVRNLAARFPYDPHHGDEAGKSLLSDGDEIAEMLKNELQTRLKVAGVTILDARLTHLAYSPEIAQAMLKRQQAEALVSARFAIVEGAVSMVELALDQLSAKGIVELDEERKAIMVNNLMVALVSESETHPVLNAGSLY